jgi:hypothetical protein
VEREVEQVDARVRDGVHEEGDVTEEDRCDEEPGDELSDEEG